MSEAETPTPASESVQVPQPFHYFLVAGEISYLDSKFNKSPKTHKVNTIYRGLGLGLIARDLGKIQTNLQMAFHQKYSRDHKEAPEVVDCIILNCCYIGTHLPEDFMAGAPGTEKTPAPATVEETKKPE